MVSNPWGSAQRSVGGEVVAPRRGVPQGAASVLPAENGGLHQRPGTQYVSQPSFNPRVTGSAIASRDSPLKTKSYS